MVADGSHGHEVLAIVRRKAGGVNFQDVLDGGCLTGLIKFCHERSPIFHAPGRLSAAPNAGGQPVPAIHGVLGDLDDIRTYLKTAQRAATLIYAHFKKEFEPPKKK